MGFNTVAVLLNDHSHEFMEKMPRLASAMQAIMRGRYHPEGGFNHDTHFGCGQVISQDHADSTQVVVVSRNSGQAVNWREGDKESLDALAEVLRQRGYAVRAPGEKRALPPHKWNQENWISSD